MRAEDALVLLHQLRAEAGTLPSSISSSEYNSWEHRTRSVLTKSLGETHHITQAFVHLRWTPGIYDMENAAEAFCAAFRSTVPTAQGLIDAAVFELQQLRSSTDIAEDAGFDPELWRHVSGHVVAEEWGKVASQTAIFTEDRIRKWAGRPAQEVGEKLMTAVFGERGDYRLGLTDGEKQGWHRLAMGVSMALRNADAHRIQSRSDHRRYAMGVLGASSLLLTQMRFEHVNRFHDTSPASQEAIFEGN